MTRSEQISVHTETSAAGSVTPQPDITIDFSDQRPPSPPQASWFTPTRLGALVLAIGVSFTAAVFAFSQVAGSDPTASVSVILNENSVGWPFYAAAQEKAEFVIADPATFDAARGDLSDPDAALELRMERPGDLSLIRVIGIADDDIAAVELAESGASRLIEISLAEQRASSEAELERLTERRGELEVARDAAAATLNSADGEAQLVTAEGQLRQTVDELGSVTTEIADLEADLDGIESEWVVLGHAELDDKGRQSVLAAVSAGAAASVLALLFLSLFFRRDQSSP